MYYLSILNSIKNFKSLNKLEDYLNFANLNDFNIICENKLNDDNSNLCFQVIEFDGVYYRRNGFVISHRFDTEYKYTTNWYIVKPKKVVRHEYK